MHLLFICTGNTCRSPLAEVIARRMIADRAIPDLTVGSAGTQAWADTPASDGSLLVALEHGLDLGDHRSRPLVPAIVNGAQVLLTMGPHHLERAEALGGTGRSWLLTEFAGETPRPISDPFGGDLGVYRDTYEELERVIDAVLNRVVADRRRPSP